MHTHRLHGGRHSATFDTDAYDRQPQKARRREVVAALGRTDAAAKLRSPAPDGSHAAGGGTGASMPRISSRHAIAELLGTESQQSMGLRRRAHDESETQTRLVAFVESTPVVFVLLLAICANAVLIGVESDSLGMEDEVGASTPGWQAVEYGFTAFFALEMALKIAACVVPSPVLVVAAAHVPCSLLCLCCACVVPVSCAYRDGDWGLPAGVCRTVGILASWRSTAFPD